MRYNEIVNEAEYQGKEVTLNQPMYNDSGSGKFKVYVTDPKDNETVKKVTFGSKDMEIKRDNKERRESFRARHKCDQYSFDKDRDKPVYWSCKMWEKNTTVSDIVSEDKDDDDDPCWEGYEQYGMKEDEDGNMVPNCIPKNKE